MDIWITSDTHFSHANIISYCNRPFKTAQEMDECMITRWNEVVKPQDHVYHLGDVTIIRGGKVRQKWLTSIISQLNGHKRLILGNHDHFPVEAYRTAGFEKVRGTGRWLHGYLLSHYPVHPSSMGSAKGCIHGHIHNSQTPPAIVYTLEDERVITKPYINACVEMHNYAPVNINTLIRRGL